MEPITNTCEDKEKNSTTDETAPFCSKPPRGRPIKNKFSPATKQAYKSFNRENRKGQSPTSTLSLLYSSLPNYGNELTNKKLSTKKYCCYFFGYYMADCYLKCVENKLQEGLRLNFNKRSEILECLPEAYIDSEGISKKFTELEMLQNFDDLPAELFVPIPILSDQFSGDFMRFMFSDLHTDNYSPELLEYELRQVQLKIERLKTKFITEIPVIDLIGQATFHIGSYEVSDINKYDEFIHLFREANIIKKQIINFEVDNELGRKLISIVNNLLKILNNYVYYKEVFLREYYLDVASRSADNDSRKNFEGKVILSLANAGIDPNRIYFNTTGTIKGFKKTIVEDPRILNAYAKKKENTLASTEAHERRYNIDYNSETIEKNLNRNVNYKGNKKTNIEFINSRPDINMTNDNVDINNNKNKTEITDQKISAIAHEPEYFLSDLRSNYPRTSMFSTRGNAQRWDKYSVPFYPNISVDNRSFIKNVEKTNMQVNFQQSSLTAQSGPSSNLKQRLDKNEFFKKEKDSCMREKYEQANSFFTASSDNTQLDPRHINTSKKLETLNIRDEYERFSPSLTKPSNKTECFLPHVDTVQGQLYSNSHHGRQQATNIKHSQTDITISHFSEKSFNASNSHYHSGNFFNTQQNTSDYFPTGERSNPSSTTEHFNIIRPQFARDLRSETNASNFKISSHDSAYGQSQNQSSFNNAPISAYINPKTVQPGTTGAATTFDLDDTQKNPRINPRLITSNFNTQQNTTRYNSKENTTRFVSQQNTPHYNTQHDIARYTPEQDIQRFDSQQKTFHHNPQQKTTYFKPQQNISHFNPPRASGYYNSPQNTTQPNSETCTPRYNSSVSEEGLNLSQITSRYGATQKASLFKPTSTTSFYNTPETSSRYHSLQITSNDDSLRNTTSFRQQQNTSYYNISPETSALNCSQDTSPSLNISRDHEYAANYMSSSFNTTRGTAGYNAVHQPLTCLGIILPRLYQLMMYTSPTSIFAEKELFDEEIVRIMKDFKQPINEFLIKIHSRRVDNFTEEELKLICRSFGLNGEEYEKNVVLSLENARKLLLRLIGIYAEELAV